MVSKFDRFIEANLAAGDLISEVNKTFGKWGYFHVDNADFILRLSRELQVSPEAIAVTWMNETSFRFYSEPNKNNQPENFEAWDVGPFQANVFWTKGDIRVKRVSAKDLTEKDMFGTVSGSQLFDGNPYANALISCRRLKKMGKTDEERVVNFTGPKARPYRLKSWQQFGPMFKKFFEVYGR